MIAPHFTAADGERLRSEGVAMVKRPNPVYMMRVEGPFTVETNEGRLESSDGYLAFDPISGHVWPVAASYVEQHYQPAVPNAPDFARWWAEHEPQEHFLDDWTHDDLRAFAEPAFEAGRLSAGSA